ncbi:TPA: hypothetical protein JBL19_06265 [Legionella pneumophila]|nr:hypothetical protein [Legionella pneumophila subsp. fraseri]HAT1796309.1 hypothetical protein [Legionella pneumophila]MDW8961451.1 hypothetical protein [Legionella pneumophila subsp. fraseri]MDW9036272.1 hypothetical protein [Legionella pneumophila subsp. fraseri]MDW9038971.1 hypothetical protein [Legionella pneumophila subsp. fraseri]
MSNIKINDVFQRIQYAASAGQTQFTIPFPFFDNEYVIVWQNGVQLNMGAAPGQYGISGAGSPSGGLITLVTPAALNDIITIQGEMPIDRTSIYSATISNLTGSDLNGDFNREVVMMKQIQTTQALLQLQYAPWLQVSQDPDVTKDRYLPLLGPQQVWMMNAQRTAIEAVTIDIDNIPAPSDAPYLVYTQNDTLTESQNLGALVTGLLKNTVSAGVATLSRAVNASDYWAPGDVIILPGPPTNGNDATTKDYVDSIATGFSFVAPVTVATTANFTSTYNNGAAGIGATLTATSNGAINIDGVALVLNDRVLVKNQTATFQNGIYYVSQVGDGSNPAILTRSTDFDTPAEIVPGMLIPVLEGTANQFTIWLNTSDPTTIGTDPIVFVQFGISTSNIVTITGNQTITGDKEFTGLVEVPTPSTGTEAANKDYVDNAVLDAGGFKAFTAFTASGTWNRAAGATKAVIMVLGGGGGGSGATGFTGSFIGTGDGGGAGETAWLELDISAISSVAVTIGSGGAGGPASAGSIGGSSGGTTSFGAHVSAAGGSGGSAMTTDGVFRYGLGGAGGTGGSGGDIQCPGFNGGGALRNGASSGVSGGGASSSYGSGGRPRCSVDGDQSGNNATGYGAGGGAAISSTNNQRAGGNASGGLCLIWEF